MDAPSLSHLPASLDANRIHALPAAAYYIADFISEEEEKAILQKVRYLVASFASIARQLKGARAPLLTETPQTKVETAPKARWRQLTHRRLQTWPSDLVKNTLLDSQPLPDWLEQPVVSRLLSIASSESESNIFASSPHRRPNHVLINEYTPGTGIMPHKDGSAYHPVVCTVSLASSLCLNLYRSKEDGALDPEPVWRILQEPRSLLITTGEVYTEYLH